MFSDDEKIFVFPFDFTAILFVCLGLISFLQRFFSLFSHEP